MCRIAGMTLFVWMLAPIRFVGWRVGTDRFGRRSHTCPEGMMTWVEAAGYLASALVLATFCMKTMIPLRSAAVVSNVAFIVYGFYDEVYPVLILHAVLLPLN